jgi:hypothetical protein
MTPRHIRRLTPLPLLVVAVITLIACGQSGASASVAPTSPTSSASPSSPVEGVVVDVESAGLGEVEAFTIRMADGQELTIAMGDLENATEFPPAHIGEHLTSGVPVRVTIVAGPDGPVAVRIEDAG